MRDPRLGEGETPTRQLMKELQVDATHTLAIRLPKAALWSMKDDKVQI